MLYEEVKETALEIMKWGICFNYIENSRALKFLMMILFYYYF